MLRRRTIPTLAAGLMALAMLAGCASAPEEGPAGPAQSAPAAQGINDPLEPVNRAVFWFNEALDVVLIKPVAQIYHAVLPDPVERGVTNVLQNLREPLNLANQALQGDWNGAGTAVKRFGINSTIGLAGIFDVAADMGMPYEYESFEQTLAIWGVPEGPYLVLPVIGSSSLRDGPALLAETFADPVRLTAQEADAEWFNWTRTILVGVDTRATYLGVIEDLRRNSFDYYAAMRSLYRQRRDGWIRDGAPDPNTFPDIPDYDDEFDAEP
ncbi:MlaA family lipoprotein [Indioceanicola profundi]|uniref:MlaA family lipoprotein n=1 Tax=Indioceanicola profundi TaxID=2220096 RepID=UPI000E6AA0BD|nr:VacJ family lipoprotein [Indioceanicola profundi]